MCPTPGSHQTLLQVSLPHLCLSSSAIYNAQSVLKEINQTVWSLISNDWFYWLFLLVAMQYILCLSAHVFILLLMYPV